jgi:hypothetical protein
MARRAAQIRGEVTRRGNKLMEDDSLGFNFANLLSDDLLGHFLEDEKSLLDNLDALGVTDKFLLLLNDGLFDNSGDRAGEIVGAVEVVESIERRETTPVVEGLMTTSVWEVDISIEKCREKGIYAYSSSGSEG